MTNTTTFIGKKTNVAIKKDLNSSVDKKKYGLAFPIGTSTTGGYFAKNSGTQLVKNNLKQLILTSKGERVMLPNFGMNLKNYLFEQLDDQTFNNVKLEILNGLARYGQGVNLLKLGVFNNDDVTPTGLQGITVKLAVEIKNTDIITDVEVKVG